MNDESKRTDPQLDAGAALSISSASTKEATGSVTGNATGNATIAGVLPLHDGVDDALWDKGLFGVFRQRT